MRAEKQLLLDEIKDRLQNSETFIMLRYQNLSVNIANQFRRAFGSVGGDFEVVRKRVFLKALEELGLDFDQNLLTGHIGIAFGGKDVVESTKVIFNFCKENPNLLDVLVGRFEGQNYDAASIKRLSKLPGLEEMRAQFLGLLETPMSQSLAVMESILTSVPYCLENSSCMAKPFVENKQNE